MCTHIRIAGSTGYRTGEGTFRNLRRINIPCLRGRNAIHTGNTTIACNRSAISTSDRRIGHITLADRSLILACNTTRSFLRCHKSIEIACLNLVIGFPVCTDDTTGIPCIRCHGCVTYSLIDIHKCIRIVIAYDTTDVSITRYFSGTCCILIPNSPCHIQLHFTCIFS